MRRTALAVLIGTVLAGWAHARTPEPINPDGIVAPVLNEICPLTVAEAEKDSVGQRIATRLGLAYEGDTFSYSDEDEQLTVLLTGVGCAFRIVGDAEMVEAADEALQRWAARKRLTDQVTDQTTAGEEGRRIERERTKRGKLSLTWQVFDDFNGRDRPSHLEGVYSTHTH